MIQKTPVVIVIALCIGLGIGFAVDGILKSGIISDQSAQIQKFQQQIEQAKMFFPPLPQEMRSIFGVVKDVRGDTITVEIIVINPFDESTQTRTVKIVNETKIVRSEQKDPAVYQREIAKFQKNIQTKSNKPSSAGLTPPDAFSQTSAKISDIAVGQQISIAASENIRNKESFTATTIIILPTTPGVIPQGGAAATSTP